MGTCIVGVSKIPSFVPTVYTLDNRNCIDYPCLQYTVLYTMYIVIADSTFWFLYKVDHDTYISIHPLSVANFENCFSHKAILSASPSVQIFITILFFICLFLS